MKPINLSTFCCSLNVAYWYFLHVLWPFYRSYFRIKNLYFHIKPVLINIYHWRSLLSPTFTPFSCLSSAFIFSYFLCNFFNLFFFFSLSNVEVITRPNKIAFLCRHYYFFFRSLMVCIYIFTDILFYFSFLLLLYLFSVFCTTLVSFFFPLECCPMYNRNSKIRNSKDHGDSGFWSYVIKYYYFYFNSITMQTKSFYVLENK